jgi:ribosomal protein S18 acetylase RimI-like enzyme
MPINTIQADLNNPKQAADMLSMLNHYAHDIMGGGAGLSEYVKTNLIGALKKRVDALVVMAYERDEPVGLAICFEGFSTFSAKPLINIHDFVVKAEYRRKGIGKNLLTTIEEVAKERGCCKITLEVLMGNKNAINLYRNFGFDNYQLEEAMGHALFLQKGL